MLLKLNLWIKSRDVIGYSSAGCPIGCGKMLGMKCFSGFVLSLQMIDDHSPAGPITWSALGAENQRLNRRLALNGEICEEKAMPSVIHFKRPRFFALSTLLLIFKPSSHMRLRLIASLPAIRRYLPSVKHTSKGELITFTPRLHRARNVSLNQQQPRNSAKMNDERICLP